MPFKKGQTIKKHENDYSSCVSVKFSDEILFRCLTENSRSVPPKNDKSIRKVLTISFRLS